MKILLIPLGLLIAVAWAGYVLFTKLHPKLYSERVNQWFWHHFDPNY